MSFTKKKIFETIDKVYDVIIMPGPANFFPRSAKLGTNNYDEFTKMKSGQCHFELDVSKHHE